MAARKIYNPRKGHGVTEELTAASFVADTLEGVIAPHDAIFQYDGQGRLVHIRYLDRNDLTPKVDND